MIIDLVDSIEYASTNCFAHQLSHSLGKIPNLKTVALADLKNHPKPEGVVCRLKQRTLHRAVNELRDVLGDTPINVFDQDPWQAYMDDSPYKGVYETAAARLNVRTFALTTNWWVDFLQKRGLPSTFVRMWVLPEYCSSEPTYEDRQINLGFIGGVHPHRRALFDRLEDLGTQVNVMGGNSLPYDRYMQSLSNIRIYIHSEDSPIVVDGQAMSLRDGFWARDVEVASRGCWSIRNRGEQSTTYLNQIKTVRLYDDIDQAPAIIADIQNMDPVLRQNQLSQSVEYIRQSNRWQETAAALTTFRS